MALGPVRRCLVVGVIAQSLALLGCGSSGENPPSGTVTFMVEPSRATVGEAMSPPVLVALSSKAGEGATGYVTVALDANPAGATLSGTRTVAAANGVAAFSDLTLDKPGVGYQLSAYASGTNLAVSRPFEVTPNPPVASVAISPAQLTATAGDQVNFSVTTLDASGNAVTGRRIDWSFGTPGMADNFGNAVCGISPGTTTVTATSEGKSATALLTITGTSSWGCCEAGC